MVYSGHGGPDLTISSRSADWGGTSPKESVRPSGWTLGGAIRRWKATCRFRRNVMKVWTKPAVREQEVGLEVTSYLPAEIDII